MKRTMIFSMSLIAVMGMLFFAACDKDEDKKEDKKEQNHEQSEGRTNKTVAGIDLIYVEGGTFTMGATPEQGEDASEYEKPAHQVTLSSYYIGKYPVTQKQWEAVMGENPALNTGDENMPVDNVSWTEIQEFITKLNQQTGKTFRMLTEAEWEYAARGGSKSQGYKYSGSNNIDEVAWYNENSENGMGWAVSHIVGQKKANELGIHDMSGNVMEWCYDWGNEYTEAAQVNPKGPSEERMFRIMRGGDYANGADYCRVSARYSDVPGLAIRNVGFRIAMELD